MSIEAMKIGKLAAVIGKEVMTMGYAISYGYNMQQKEVLRDVETPDERWPLAAIAMRNQLNGE